MSRFEPFQRWANLDNLAVLDSETTGLYGEVIELAIVDGHGQTLFDERMKPRCEVEPGAQRIHGISDADLAGLPGIEVHWPRLSEIFSSRHIVIYNQSFDTGVLSRSLDAAMPNWHIGPGSDGGPFSDAYRPFQHFTRTSECVMQAYAPVYGDWNGHFHSYRWAKLVHACQRERVRTDDLDQAHSALGDALRTLRLIQAVASRADAQGSEA